MALITLSPWLIPPPASVDVSSAEGLSKAMHLFEPRRQVGLSRLDYIGISITLKWWYSVSTMN